jgi:hypothetical protein
MYSSVLAAEETTKAVLKKLLVEDANDNALKCLAIVFFVNVLQFDMEARQRDKVILCHVLVDFIEKKYKNVVSEFSAETSKKNTDKLYLLAAMCKCLQIFIFDKSCYGECVSIISPIMPILGSIIGIKEDGEGDANIFSPLKHQLGTRSHAKAQCMYLAAAVCGFDIQSGSSKLPQGFQQLETVVRDQRQFMCSIFMSNGLVGLMNDAVAANDLDLVVGCLSFLSALCSEGSLNAELSTHGAPAAISKLLVSHGVSLSNGDEIVVRICNLGLQCLYDLLRPSGGGGGGGGVFAQSPGTLQAAVKVIAFVRSGNQQNGMYTHAFVLSIKLIGIFSEDASSWATLNAPGGAMTTLHDVLGSYSTKPFLSEQDIMVACEIVGVVRRVGADVVPSNGVLVTLLNLMGASMTQDQQANDAVTVCAAGCLGMLAFGNEATRVFVIDTANLAHISQILSGRNLANGGAARDPQVITHTLQLVHALSKSTDGTRRDRVAQQPGMIPNLLALVKTESDGNRNLALTTISQLGLEGEGVWEHILSTNDLTSTLALMSQQGQTASAGRACACMAQLCENNPANLEQAINYGVIDQLLGTFVVSSNPQVKGAAIESIGRLVVHSRVQEKLVGENSSQCLPMLVAAIQTDDGSSQASLKTFRVLCESQAVNLWQAVRRIGLRAEIIRPVLRKVQACGVDGVLVMCSCVQTNAHVGFENDFINASGQLLDVAMGQNEAKADGGKIRSAILELLEALSGGDSAQFANSLFHANGIQRLVQLWSSVDDEVGKGKLMALLASILCTVDAPTMVEASLAVGILPCTMHAIDKSLDGDDAAGSSSNGLNVSLQILEMLSAKANREEDFQTIVDHPLLLSLLGRFASGENRGDGGGYVELGMAIQTLSNLCAVYTQRLPILGEDSVMKAVTNLVQMASDGSEELFVAQGKACSLLSRLTLVMLESEEGMEQNLQPLVEPLCSIIASAVANFASTSDTMVDAASGIVSCLVSFVRHPHLRRLVCEKGLATVVSMVELCNTSFIINSSANVLNGAGLALMKGLVLVLVAISASWDTSASLSSSKAPSVMVNILSSISKMSPVVVDPWRRCVGENTVHVLSNSCLRKVGRASVHAALEQLDAPLPLGGGETAHKCAVARSLVCIFDGLQKCETTEDMFRELQESLGCVCAWPPPNNPDRGRLVSVPSYRESLPVSRAPQQTTRSSFDQSQPPSGRSSFDQTSSNTSGRTSFDQTAAPSVAPVRAFDPNTGLPISTAAHTAPSSGYGNPTTATATASSLPPSYANPAAAYPTATASSLPPSYANPAAVYPTSATATATASSLPPSYSNPTPVHPTSAAVINPTSYYPSPAATSGAVVTGRLVGAGATPNQVCFR